MDSRRVRAGIQPLLDGRPNARIPFTHHDYLSRPAQMDDLLVAERFIKQKHLRPAHNRPADGHPLPLPAGKDLGLRSSRFSIPSIFAASCARRPVPSFENRLGLRPNALFLQTVMCGYRA